MWLYSFIRIAFSCYWNINYKYFCLHRQVAAFPPQHCHRKTDQARVTRQSHITPQQCLRQSSWRELWDMEEICMRFITVAMYEESPPPENCLNIVFKHSSVVSSVCKRGLAPGRYTRDFIRPSVNLHVSYIWASVCHQPVQWGHPSVLLPLYARECSVKTVRIQGETMCKKELNLRCCAYLPMVSHYQQQCIRKGRADEEELMLDYKDTKMLCVLIRI